MAFGVWYDDKDNMFLMDANGRKLDANNARMKVEAILAEKPKEELLTALMDRLDVTDLIGHLADHKGNFLPGVMGEDFSDINKVLQEIQNTTPPKEEESPFANYKPGDKVVATCDCDNVMRGATDEVESVSSNHHGGLQLNLKKYGRGWSNGVWRKPIEFTCDVKTDGPVLTNEKTDERAQSLEWL